MNRERIDLDRYMAATVAHGERPVTLEANVAVIMCVVANLQLALRHPANLGASAQTVREFVGQMSEILGTLDPVFAEAIAQGADPRYDLAVTEAACMSAPVRAARVITIDHGSDEDDIFAEERKKRSECREAVAAAVPALERLCEVMKGRSGQPYKVRALLYSLWNGKPAGLIEVLGLDWEIRKDLCAVVLAFGYEDPKTSFFYKQIKAAVTKAGQWEWFIQAGGEE